MAIADPPESVILSAFDLVIQGMNRTVALVPDNSIGKLDAEIHDLRTAFTATQRVVDRQVSERLRQRNTCHR
ncbi:hypothetical protein FRC02_002220 [Tulasnella sp. 418]|nr:hypothetical protein FRC02_002220 [Tulasnella sp. 418]